MLLLRITTPLPPFNPGHGCTHFAHPRSSPLAPKSSRAKKFPRPDVQAVLVLGLNFISYDPRLHAYGFATLHQSDPARVLCRFKLSIDPLFPEVPHAPAFALRACMVTHTSEAIPGGTRYALLFDTSQERFPAFAFNQVTEAFPPLRRFMVAQLHFNDWVEAGNFTRQPPL